MNQPTSQDTNSNEWFYSPKNTTVPRYQPAIAERHQPKAARAHRRESLRKLNADPWRHFWLPTGSRARTTHARLDSSASSDSENELPFQDRFPFREPLDDSARAEDVESWQAPPPDPDLWQTQQADPDISPHSCRHCRRVAIDLRRQHAHETLPADEERPKGWRIQPTPIGLTFGEALRAAADGCAFFSFVIGTLRAQGSQVERDPSEITITGTMQGGASLGFSIQVRDQASGTVQQRYNPTQSLDLYTVPGTKPLHGFLGHYLPPNLLPNSSLSFSRARRWLGACNNCHISCKTSKSGRPYMPKRVLEIRSLKPGEQTPQPLRTRLVTNVPPAFYSALSYCWGGDQMAKTVKANAAAYAHDIPVHTLPQTIQDALIVTRGLGLKYLWVDAMCIVQDDDSDKEEQIGQMYAVYRSAYVTISAATATTSREGFLQPRTQFRGFELAARLDDNVFGRVIAMPEPKWFSKVGQGSEYPLFSRGWTYQEHQLSPRILVYGLCEMVYWCNEASHRDGGHERLYWPSHSQYASRIFYLGQLGIGGKGTQPQSLVHPAGWADVVENYSSRDLTVEDDKLPAVAAVAEKYAEMAPVTDYLAGMWREDLLLQCLWRVWDPKKATRSRSYRAPSWSWASINGAIYPWSPQDPADGPACDLSCVLLAAETTLCSTKIRFGSVKTGFMSVRARMRRVLWFNYDEYHGGRYQALNLSHGRDPAASDDELALLLGQFNGADPRLTLMIDVVGEWPAGSEITLWTLEICTGEGILLQELTQEPPAGRGAVFRRVGRISVQTQDFMIEPFWFNDIESEWQEITIV